MNNVFINLFNISIMASWLVLAIVIIRLIFKKIPKSIYCILWGIVGLRLILPFSLETTLSLIPSTNTIDTTIHTSKPTIQTGIEIVDNNINNYLSSNYFEGVTVETDFFSSLISELTIVWIIGVILMIIYACYSYYKIYKQVQASILYKNNIYYCDDIDSPFILGIIYPKIYIPSYLDEKEMLYVLKHEQAHLKRKDHFYKPIGFMLLSIYWFNPILWIAYILLCRDIEAACDEKVIKDMNTTSKKEYSETLFNCSVQRNMIMVCPLAFGEVGVKQRIKSVINYKKPSFWIIVLSIVLCVSISIGFLTNPKYNRLVDINDPTIHITLLDNVSDVVFTNSNIDVSHNDDVDELVSLLYKVEINPKEISLSRSEDRDKTNQIGLIYNNNLSNMTYLNFNSDYTEVWIDDGVKPTFSYKVKNSNFVKKMFNTYQSKDIKKVSESFNAEVIGFENNQIVIQPFDTEEERKISNKFYIDENVINEIMKFKVNIGSQIEVVYDGNIFERDKKIATVHEIHLLNNVMNYNEGLNAFLVSSISDYYGGSYTYTKGIYRNYEYIILGSKGNIAFHTNEASFKEYIVVLPQQFKVENNELMIEDICFETMEVSYKVNSTGHYTLDSIYTTTNKTNIKERFPSSCVEQALNYEQYYDQLKNTSLENMTYYLSVFEKELYNNLFNYEKILNELKKFDNGYTEEDYNSAKGEDCLHPRVKYSSKNIEIEIWSDPHRLFCYVVKVRDLDALKFTKFYMDTDDYETIQKHLEKYNLIKSYM